MYNYISKTNTNRLRKLEWRKSLMLEYMFNNLSLIDKYQTLYEDGIDIKKIQKNVFNNTHFFLLQLEVYLKYFQE